MESIISILERVEARAGLSRHDGHPLYAYRMDDLTLEALEQVLRHTLACGEVLDGFACAGLCLFAAEHFCLTHESGAWSWHDVFASVGFDRGRQEWYRSIERGLRYWGRPLLHSGSEREFLLTLACEGGLPRKLLHREEQHLTRYLRRLLADHERYTHTPTAHLAERHQNVLPDSLHNETVRELCCRLVDEVARLRAEAGSSVDVETLDARAPGWRQRLPLRLDDGVAEQLLQGLLREAKAAATRERGLIRVEVTLADEPLRIVRRVRLPPEIDAAVLAEMLGQNEAALPSRMQLYVHSLDGGSQVVANATLFDTGYGLVPPRGRATIIDSMARLTLVAMAGTLEIGRGELDGGDELSGALPWVFADKGEAEAQALVGVGSLRTQHERVRVLVPKGAELVAGEGATVSDLGDIAQPEGRVVVLCGSAQVRMEEDVYRVVTGAREETAQRYLLRGRHSNLGIGGSDVWYGLPLVLCAAGDKMPAAVPQAQVQWRYMHRTAGWQRAGKPAGDIVLRVLEGGETRFRARLTVVPQELRCRLLPGNQPRSGVIQLEQSGATDMSCEIPGGVLCEVKQAGSGRFDVRVSSGPVPPPALGIRLMFPGGGEARVDVPFPSAMPMFVDRAGRPMGDDAEVSLRQLVGAFAVVHAPRPRSKFRLSCRLNRGGPGWMELADLVSEQGQTVTLSLDTVQDRVENLLTSVDALDAYVELRLIEIGVGSLVNIRVRHYDAALDRETAEDGEAVDLLLSENGLAALRPTQVAALCVEARPIEAPGETPVALPPIEAGRWRFDKRQRTPGGWLITGRIESLMVLRPILVSVIGEEAAGSDDVNSMIRAVRIHRRDERKDALHEVVASLGADFGHPDWRLMNEYLAAMKTLPASTFDPIKAIAQSPDAAVKALFQARDAEHFDVIWDGLEDLPFLWKLVPVRSWLHAAREYRDYVSARLAEMEASSLDPVRLARETILRVVEWAARRSLHLGWLRLLLRDVFDQEAEAPEIALEQRKQMLLRQPGRWPECSQELDALLDELRVPKQLRDLSDLSYRHSVLNAPTLAAAAAVDGHALDDHLIFELRRMRAFDEEWFEHAHAQAFIQILHIRFTENSEFLR
jgi:hypothetical protein